MVDVRELSVRMVTSAWMIIKLRNEESAAIYDKQGVSDCCIKQIGQFRHIDGSFSPAKPHLNVNTLAAHSSNRANRRAIAVDAHASPVPTCVPDTTVSENETSHLSQQL